MCFGVTFSEMWLIFCLSLDRWSAGAVQWQSETFPFRPHHEPDPQEAHSLRQEAAGTLPVSRPDRDPWGWRGGGERTDLRWAVRFVLWCFTAAWEFDIIFYVIFLFKNVKVLCFRCCWGSREWVWRRLGSSGCVPAAVGEESRQQEPQPGSLWPHCYRPAGARWL